MKDNEDIWLWNLADTLTLPQAALLADDLNPAIYMVEDPERPETAYIKTDDGTYISPVRFRTVYCAIIAAANVEKLKVSWFYGENFGNALYAKSTVDVEELKRWFNSRNFRPKFFYYEPEIQEFKNFNHPRYAAKLAAIVSAWEATKEAAPNKTVKQTLALWLNKNAVQFDLIDDDGTPRKKTIEELASIANWEPSGGAPKTRAKVIEKEVEMNKNHNENRDTFNDFLDDVPF